jgi:hypothetical protein
MQRSSRLSHQEEKDQHITGPMYENVPATPYNADNLLNENAVWFEPAIDEPF